jgi:uncharacterized protein
MNDTNPLAPEPAPKTEYPTGLGGQEIRFQRCTWCASAQLRPSTICRVCAGDNLTWERSSGLGKVTPIRSVTQKAQFPPALSLIQLDEGSQVAGWIVGESWHELHPGSRVRISLNDDTSTHPVFELADRPEADQRPRNILEGPASRLSAVSGQPPHQGWGWGAFLGA